MDIIAFPDHLSSLFQSAATDLARAKLAPGAPTPGTENVHINAATQIAALWNSRQPIPATAPAGIDQRSWTCAARGFQLMQAAASGNAAQVAALQAEDQFSLCDPDWVKVTLNYVTFLAKNGMRDKIPYIRAASISPIPIAMQALPLKVALIGDWGTGTVTATTLLQQVAAHNPDMLIHLGDVYYSGTPTECRDNFQMVVDRIFNRDTKPFPVFTLSGNHDMYSGGEGYYALLQSLNPPRTRQSASFFCLRDPGNSWQFVAMDTGLHDEDPFNVDTVQTFLEPDEQAWLTARLSEFPGRTILLSHHQLFSALSQIGPKDANGKLNPVNPYLQTSYVEFAKAAAGGIAAWFWGHEHMLTIYEPYASAGLAKGRCLGCSAVPVGASDTTYRPLENLIDTPAFLDTKLPVDTNGFYAHGFAILTLNADKTCTAEYYHDLEPTAPIYVESI